MILFVENTKGDKLIVNTREMESVDENTDGTFTIRMKNGIKIKINSREYANLAWELEGKKLE